MKWRCPQSFSRRNSSPKAVVIVMERSLRACLSRPSALRGCTSRPDSEPGGSRRHGRRLRLEAQARLINQLGAPRGSGPIILKPTLGRRKAAKGATHASPNDSGQRPAWWGPLGSRIETFEFREIDPGDPGGGWPSSQRTEALRRKGKAATQLSLDWHFFPRVRGFRVKAEDAPRHLRRQLEHPRHERDIARCTFVRWRT